MKNSQQKEKLWIEAKKKCRLNNEEVRMAKELGLNPVKLIKNIPSKSQPWKSPVKEWLHDIYEKHQAKIAKRKARRAKNNK
ncbi:MAG: hypothetical protein ABIG61_14975 [Planctomycetota bacterium]